MDNYGMSIKMDECFAGEIESHTYENIVVLNAFHHWQVNFSVPFLY